MSTRNIDSNKFIIHATLFHNTKVVALIMHFFCCLCFQPVELLHKPLLEFEEELLPDGASIRTIYELYDAHETERQSKYFNPYIAEILLFE